MAGPASGTTYSGTWNKKINKNNFLHSYSIEKQLRVAQIEENTKVPDKFRFQFFTEMQWYALDKYVYALRARSHLQLDDETVVRLFGDKWAREEFRSKIAPGHQLTAQELFGLKAIVMFVAALPVARKNVPALFVAPVSLFRDEREVVESHKGSAPEKAVKS